MPLRNRILLFAWFFYFGSLPLFKSFASIAEGALIILSLWPGTFSGFKPTVLKYKAVAAIALVFVMLLWGMFYTEDLHAGWKVLKHQHRFLVIPFLFLAHATLLQKNFKKLVFTFVVATSLACAFTCALYFLPESMVKQLANSSKLFIDYPDNADRTAFGLYTPFIDRIQFSSIVAVAIISSIFLLVSQHKRNLLFLALPLLFYTLLILGGRGGQLALFVACLVYAAALAVSEIAPRLSVRFGKLKTYSLLGLAGLILFIGLPLLSLKMVAPIQNRMKQTLWEISVFEDNTYRNFDYVHFTTFRRIVSIKNMWEVVKQNPWLGVGTGDYKTEITAVYAQKTPEMEVNTHSQYLLFWAMSGIFGLLLFLAVLGYWLFSLHRNQQLYFYGLAFLVFYLVNMLPDSVLATQVDSMVFCSFLALIGLQVNKPEGGLHA